MLIKLLFSALKVLESVYRLRDGGLILLNADPRFDSLKSDPRFQGLLQRIDLPHQEPPGRKSL